MTPFPYPAPPSQTPPTADPLVVRPVTDRSAWEAFLRTLEPHTFLQSWPWGDFNARQGHRIFRLGVWRQGGDGQLIAVTLVVYLQAKRGSFLFCPHGPVVHPSDTAAVLPPVTAYLRQLGRTLGARFIRLSTQLPDRREFSLLLRRYNFRPAPTHMHPELAWLLDLAPAEPALLGGMRKTMRNLIRRSQRLGVMVRPANSAGEFQRFLKLYRQTAERHHYVAFPPRYLEDEREAFGPNDAVVLLAEHQDALLAGAFIIFAGRSAFYHHGASQPASAHIPAAYLLQWEAIRLARRRGCRWYNFWGIAPPDLPRHPWAGLTKFKQGFGGFSERYLHAQDCPLHPSYWVTYAIERVRRVRRGL